MPQLSNYNLYKILERELEHRNDVFISYNAILNSTFIFQEHMCDINSFNRDLLPQLVNRKDEAIDEVLTGLARPVPTDDEKTIEKIFQIIFQGLMIYYDHNRNNFYLVDISHAIRRNTSDSITEPPNILGSRDGFTENFKDNISLIRMRVKSSNLSIDEFMIGRRSKTWVGLISIDDIHDQKQRKQLQEKLQSIDIDAVITFSDVVNHLNPRSVFPFYDYVGTPDLASKKLLDGQFLIIIDRIPVVINLPTSFGLMTKLTDNNIGGRSYQFIQRLFMLIALIVSTIGLGIVLSVLTYQIDILSLTVLSTLKVTQKGAIFPIWMEIIMILILFELYHLIGFRSTQSTVSNVIVLVGGLIIGQNAIESGIVGVIVMTLTALAFLCSFVVSNNVLLLRGISVIRIIFILSALFMGLYGVTLAAIVMIIYFSKQSFLDLHFFHPFIPLDMTDLMRYFTPRSSKKVKKRINSLHLEDQTLKGEQS